MGVCKTRTRQSKWKKEKNGEMVTRICVVCKEEEEDWDHYDYECKGVREMNERVVRSGEKTGVQAFSRTEWSLEEEGMGKHMMLGIAKAPWIYNWESCKMDKRQRGKPNIETLMNRLHRRMKII